MSNKRRKSPDFGSENEAKRKNRFNFVQETQSLEENFNQAELDPALRLNGQFQHTFPIIDGQVN